MGSVVDIVRDTSGFFLPTHDHRDGRRNHRGFHPPDGDVDGSRVVVMISSAWRPVQQTEVARQAEQQVADGLGPVPGSTRTSPEMPANSFMGVDAATKRAAKSRLRALPVQGLEKALQGDFQATQASMKAAWIGNQREAGLITTSSFWRCCGGRCPVEDESFRVFRDHF